MTCTLSLMVPTTLTEYEERAAGFGSALPLGRALAVLPLTTYIVDRSQLCCLATSQLTEEEKRVINRRFEYDGEEGQVEMLCGRRKSKKTYEYEVKWVGRRENKNSWITREKCARLLLSQTTCCLFSLPPSAH